MHDPELHAPEVAVSTVPPASGEIQRSHSNIRIKVVQPHAELSTISEVTRTRILQLIHNMNQPLSVAFSDISLLEPFMKPEVRREIDQNLLYIRHSIHEHMGILREVPVGSSLESTFEFVSRLTRLVDTLRANLSLTLDGILHDEPLEDYEQCLQLLHKLYPYFEDILSICFKGDVESQRALFDVASLVEDVLHRQQPRLDVTLHFRPPDPVFIDGDVRQLEQVFENLISNACKYGNRASVSVFLHQEDSVHIMVSDNGPGIADDEHTLFGMLERGVNAQNTDGYGIGLAFCKKVVDEHGGVIGVCNILKEGSHQVEGACFTVQLPLKKE